MIIGAKIKSLEKGLKLGGFSKGPPMLFLKKNCDVVEVAIICRKI